MDTLAEALSKHFRRPLYSVRIWQMRGEPCLQHRSRPGKLSFDATELEAQLTHIFQMAHAWNPLILLVEADVFLQRRAELTLDRNRLIAVFLRRLEYYDGVLFLANNLIHHFNDAILNRVHLMMKHDKLEKAARETIIHHFLESLNSSQGLSNIGTGYVDRFACVSLNGQQLSHSPLKAERWLTCC